MGVHTCTKDLLSILPMVSDFCWWCTMSHSASQHTTCPTGSIKNPHLHHKISRKTRLINIPLTITAPLVRRTYLCGSWCSQLHTLAFILNPKTLEVSITAPDLFPAVHSAPPPKPRGIRGHTGQGTFTNSKCL